MSAGSANHNTHSPCADTRHSCSQPHGYSATTRVVAGARRAPRYFCVNKHAHDHVEGSRDGGGEREIERAKPSRCPIWKVVAKSERRVTRFGLGVGSDWGSGDMENGTQELVRDEGRGNSGNRAAHALQNTITSLR